MELWTTPLRSDFLIDRYQVCARECTFNGCPYILIYYYITIYACVPHFYYLSALIDCWSSALVSRIIYKCLNVCPFGYTDVAIGGKAELSETGLTKPVGWLLLLQLTVLSRSAVVVLLKSLVAFLCCHVAFFYYFQGVGAFIIGLSQISSFSFCPELLWSFHFCGKYLCVILWGASTCK